MGTEKIEQLSSTNLWVSFRKSALQHWDKIAVDDEDGTLTYGQLHERALRIVARLKETAEDRGPILLLFDDVSQAIPAILACCRVGRPYVPIRSDDAASRVEWILDNTQSQTILTETGCRQRAEELSLGKTLLICDTDEPYEPATADTQEPGENLWIIYTSGSTGRPKGVVQTHRNISQYVATYADGLSISSEDRISLLLSYSSNFANHLIFTTLLQGATLCVYDVHSRGIADLSSWILASRVSLLVAVPTLFRHVFGAATVQTTHFQSVRWVMMIGELVSIREFEIFRRVFPPAAGFCNRYGSTETGTVSWSMFRGEDSIEAKLVPIGQPGPGFEVLLLDEDGTVVNQGAVGEMVVQSEFLSPGYWRDPERTAEVFLEQPGSRNLRRFITGDLARWDETQGLIHLGRKDFQIKVRGYRVEPAEIEAALLTHPSINDALVHVLKEEDEQRLVAYIICGEEAPTVTAMRRHLAEQIPEYMIPTAFVELEAFPLAPNGKVNRSALPPVGVRRPRLDTTYLEPISPFEKCLERIWQEVLCVEKIGVRDSFFELGGDSLRAMRMNARIQAQFGIAPTLEKFYEHPVIESIADWLLEQMTKPDWRVPGDVRGTSE